MRKHDIELCLTLYALSGEYINGRMTLEDCLKRGREMGYTGVELVASQMVPEYPHPSKEWMDEFVALLKNMKCIRFATAPISTWEHILTEI